MSARDHLLQRTAARLYERVTAHLERDGYDVLRWNVGAVQDEIVAELRAFVRARERVRRRRTG